MTFWSNDPVTDAERYDDEMRRRLERHPRCHWCNEFIQDETYYDIDGEIFCECCCHDLFLVRTEDFV